MCNNCDSMRQKNERGQGPAFLLGQLGAHAATQFAERLKALDLAPPDAGILRVLRTEPGLSQQDLAAKLKIHPSRLVALLDNLEKRGLVERKANPNDRRLYSLHLAAAGEESLASIGKIAREHQQELFTALTQEELEKLTALLQKIADHQGLERGIHPGYQRLGRRDGDRDGC
jgi:DNA-binding MarR family transcriptional regulator